MKNIIITGTSRGIGFELALQFANAGHQVLAISRKTPKELIEHSNINCLSVDLSEESGLNVIKEFITHTWKNVDVLIHNAGSLVLKPFLQLSQADFEMVYKVNVFGVASLTRIALPYLNPGSHVVTISSMGGIQGSMKFAGLAAYSTSKAALCSFTELFAEEYKETTIKMNCLCLGAVQTEMLEQAFPGYQAPLSPEQMAAFIADFSLGAHQYLNGKIIPVSLTNP